jgi:hypothetical protein
LGQSLQPIGVGEPPGFAGGYSLHRSWNSFSPLNNPTKLRGRHVFLVFMLRLVGKELKLRPISARYMHRREIDQYEKQTEEDAFTHE